MKIQKRIVLTVAVANILALLGTYSQFHFIISEEFGQIEARENALQTKRATVALDIVQERLTSSVSDWAKWDDTYEYMRTRNPKYFESVVTYDYVVSLKVEHILFLDIKGEVVRAFSVDTNAGEIHSTTKSTIDKILHYQSLRQPSTDAPVSGYLTLEGSAFVAASVAIQDSNISKPARGAIVFLRRFDEKLLSEVSRQTQLALSLHEVSTVDVASEILSSPAGLVNNDPAPSSRIVTDSSVRLLLPRNDLLGQPYLVFEITEPRPIYAQIQRTRDSILGVLFGGALLTISLSILILRSFVVSRIRSLVNQIQELRSERKYEGKLNCQGEDEVAELAINFNSLLENIRLSQVELESARDLAESANAAKSSFLAKVSHELRTPIHGILGMHRMVMRQEKSRAIRELIGVADNCARGLLGTINEILDFSKAESGNLTVENIPVTVRDVVRSAMQVVSGRLDNKPKLQLVCDLDPRVPEQVQSDPTRLQQVLVNLVGNAVKFTESGSVTLRVRYDTTSASEGALRFEVSDTGIGIPQDKLSDIFEPFKQADDTVTRKYSGTGLGLSIVKQFCDTVGGIVHVTSIEGKGSTFTVSLPVRDTPVREIDLLSRSQSWPVPLFVGYESPTLDSLQGNCKTLGLSSTWVDARKVAVREELLSHLATHNLFVVFDEALQNSEIFNEVVARAKAGDIPGERCTVAVLAPSNLEVREQLYAAGLKTILTSPVLCDDIVDAFFGKQVAQSDSEENSGEPLAFGRKLRVLVADDSETNRIILEDMLTSAGHEVVCVEDGQDVVAQLRSIIRGEPGATPYDVVLSDIQMPYLDGWSTAKAVRAVEKEAGGITRTPIIAATAHPIENKDSRLAEAGIDGVVSKPIEPLELATQIRRILGGDNSQEIVRPHVTETSVVQFEVELDHLVRNLIANEKQSVVGSDRDSLPPDFLNIPSLYRRLGRSLPRTLLVLQVSIPSIHDRLDKLSAALSDNNSVEVKRSAHALRGLLLEVGASETAGLAGEIEEVVTKTPTEGSAEVDCTSISKLNHDARLVAKLLDDVSQCLTHRTAGTEQSLRTPNRETV